MTETSARYHINLFWSAEDECWIADVPDLRFCSAFGASPEAAVREVQVAMQAWLESAREHADPILQPRYRPAIYAAQAVGKRRQLLFDATNGTTLSRGVSLKDLIF